MWNSLPDFGTAMLCAILVAACYTLGVSIAAGAGRPRLLRAARSGAYTTVGLVGTAVLVLAYAFVTHDFRLDYVAHYSDRTMSTAWLIAALWGGQDGSLLWWLFLTALFAGACVWWLRGRYRELQPYIIATLMSVVVFIALLMLFATNPFRMLPAGPALDGQGLNYQLRNFYMIIHPPSLYIGFTSCAVPFAFAMAALITGRLDNEWIVASRKWMLFSWLFLSIGNALGMLWAYEELGWGGYWAWDPVENASFLPWLTASAYVHSVMIQERRGMFKVWNLVLICLTFFLTYFGTFLTRSGLIASVHAFAQSGIGIFFVWYMGIIVAGCTALIIYRAPLLRARGQLDSPLSREFTFVINNWALLSLTVFIATATVWPRISEWLLEQKSTLGPSFYNSFVPPVALVLIFLMGTAPLLGWRKSTKGLLYRSFRIPLGVMAATIVLHLGFGERLGFAPFVQSEPLYSSWFGGVLAWVQGKLPLITVALVAYNFAVIGQEIYRGVHARRRHQPGEGVARAFFHLVRISRRRYGGYVVHLGIAVMFLGFAGRAWGASEEASLEPGETLTVQEYTLKYVGPRMDVDHEKRMIFADLDVERYGQPAGRLSPGKYIYKASPERPSTEVARLVTVKNDLYVISGMINPNTKVAAFQVHINPLVSFVWLGVAILILGASVSLWPEVTRERRVGAFGYARAFGSVATMVMLSVWLALAPSQAWGQEHQPDPGSVLPRSPAERALFQQLLCNCGTCPHEPLASCTCGWAQNARRSIRAKLAAGQSPAQILAAYTKDNGTDSVIMQADRGGQLAVWVVPLVLALGAGAGIYGMGRKWSRQSSEDGNSNDGSAPDGDSADGADEALDGYDERLDEELRNIDEER